MPGGRRLASARHHLEQAGLTETDWHAAWASRRFFFGAMGNAGKPGGNPCLTLDTQGRLTVSVPSTVAAHHGIATRMQLTGRVAIRHGGEELAARVAARAATRFDIERVERRGRLRWYLRASWSISPTPVLPRSAVTADGVLGVDLNADHLAAHVVDSSGNPVGTPHRVELCLRDPVTARRLPGSTRDARVREAISTLLDRASAAGVGAVVVEDLGFAEAEKSRERYGRNRGFRTLVAGFPTTAFRTRLAGMAARRGLPVVAVDPRYTSVVGARDWAPSLSTTHRPVTGHDGAAVTIGRRGLALPLRAHRAVNVRSAPHRRMEAATTGQRGGGTDTRTSASSYRAKPDGTGRRGPDPAPAPLSGRGPGGPGNPPAALPAHRRRREHSGPHLSRGEGRGACHGTTSSGQVPATPSRGRPPRSRRR
jgi:hypothetical protein